MDVWIIKKNKRYNYSKKVLEEIYFKITKKKFDKNKVTYGKYGKPYYENFYFNITHSKNYIAIVTSNSKVGIDLEERNRKIHKNVSNMILSKDESIIDDNILNNWVIKEAYSKFIGYGLNVNFKTINAQDLLENEFMYNISNNNYICYVIGKEKLDRINETISSEV